MATINHIFGTKTTDVLYSNGFVNGLGLDPVLETGNTFYLKWNYSNMSDAIWNVSFRDGSCLGGTKTEQQIAGGLVESGFYDFKTVKSSQRDLAALQSSPLSYVPDKGNGFLIEWTPVSLTDQPDFYSYLLYQASGSGWLPIAELAGVNYNKYTVGGLIDGNWYIYKLEYKDYLGNISNNNSGFSGQVNTNPLPVSGSSGFPWTSGSGSGATSGTVTSGYNVPAMTWDSGARTITLSGIAPSGQHADLAYYAVYNNFNPEYGLMDYLNDEPVAILYSGMIYTSQELYYGTWKWAMVAVDTLGFTSDANILSFGISASGTLLPALPTAPYSVLCSPSVSGTVYTNVSFGEVPSNVETITVSLGANSYTHTYSGGFYSYDYTFSGLVEGTPYTVTAYSSNSGSNSAIISGNSATPDATPPSGSSILTITKVMA